MLTGVAYPPKDPSETFAVGIRFREIDTNAGETILTATATVKRLNDAADVSTEFLAGSPVIDGPVLKHRIRAGDAGKRYRVFIQVNTSLANVYRHWLDVPMVAA
jgi:hypothetical protein